MLTKRILTPLLAGVLLVGAAACGSDDESADGGDFCTAAKAAEAAGNAVNFDSGTPADIETTVKASVEASKAAQKVAPDEISDVIDQVVKYQEQMADALEKNDWDLIAASQDPDLIELVSSGDMETASAELDQYLADECDMPFD